MDKIATRGEQLDTREQRIAAEKQRADDITAVRDFIFRRGTVTAYDAFNRLFPRGTEGA